MAHIEIQVSDRGADENLVVVAKDVQGAEDTIVAEVFKIIDARRLEMNRRIIAANIERGKLPLEVAMAADRVVAQLLGQEPVPGPTYPEEVVPATNGVPAV